MKLSVSIPSADVEFLDAYASEHGLPSRSAALHRAVDALRLAVLPGAYAEAWTEFEDGSAWEHAIGDGLS